MSVYSILHNRVNSLRIYSIRPCHRLKMVLKLLYNCYYGIKGSLSKLWQKDFGRNTNE